MNRSRVMTLENVGAAMVAVLVIVVLFVAYLSLFTVYQTRQALVVRLGEPVRMTDGLLASSSNFRRRRLT